MKKINSYILLVFLLTGFFLSSCNKDNGTTPALTRDSLTGKWLVSESKKKATYEVSISIDPVSSNGILINNFGGGGLDVNVIAYLSGVTVSLKSDQLLANGWIVNGNGTVSGTTRINWTYTYHDGADLNTVQAVFAKK
jgi:hypothetical protein